MRNKSSDRFIFQQLNQMCYCKAQEIVAGNILEIRAKTCYGISALSPYTVKSFTVYDDGNTGTQECKKDSAYELKSLLLDYFDDNSFDYVISLNTIEHIYNDSDVIREIARVLTPEGKLIISTPNRKMSLTYPPCYVQQYTANEFKYLLGEYFTSIEAYGMFGNDKVIEYYNNKKEIIDSLKRIEVTYNLPGGLFHTFYNIRKHGLLKKYYNLEKNISMKDYYFDKIENNYDNSFELFYIASK
ncbi:MAG: methyltransferase domain-containing protein [Bacteroidales bacterium]|nr:methyltransferase domain-containing protein [Bacteroidales bacterium]